MIRAAAHLITAWHRHSRAAPRDTLAADVQWQTRPVRIIVAQERPVRPPDLIARFLAEKALRDANLRVFAALDLHGFAGAQYMPDRLGYATADRNPPANASGNARRGARRNRP